MSKTPYQQELGLQKLERALFGPKGKKLLVYRDDIDGGCMLLTPEKWVPKPTEEYLEAKVKQEEAEIAAEAKIDAVSSANAMERCV